jgi:hypothetical protein
MTVLAETADNLRAFLIGHMSAQELEGWIISALDDDSFLASRDERSSLEEIRLLLLEYGENMRSIDDARIKVASLLGESMPHATKAS